MTLLSAVGDVDFVGCQAGIDGGAIYTTASIVFGIPGQHARAAIASNSAGGKGGGVMAFSSMAELQVNYVY